MFEKSIKSPVQFFAALLLVLFFTPAAPSADSASIDRARFAKIHRMYALYKKEAFPTAPDVSVDKFLQWQKQESVILVDVRSSKERRVSMIPGAISQKEFKKSVKQFGGQKIILYCTIGYRSGEQVIKMRKKGVDAYNLIGGVLAWAHAGQFFSSSDGDSLRVHVYGKTWNLAPEKYRPVW